MRVHTVRNYNPTATAMLFAVIAAAIAAAIIALFAWQPWAPASQTTNNNSTTTSQGTSNSQPNP